MLSGPDVTNLSFNQVSYNPGDIAILTAEITDKRYSKNEIDVPSQDIQSATYYIDIAPWEGGASGMGMTASDGKLNSNEETVEATIDTTGLDGGKHIIYVVGADADGSVGAFSAIFLQINGDVPTPTISSCQYPTASPTTSFRPTASPTTSAPTPRKCKAGDVECNPDVDCCKWSWHECLPSGNTYKCMAPCKEWPFC